MVYFVFDAFTSVSLSAKDIYSPVLSPSNRKYDKVGEYNEKIPQSQTNPWHQEEEAQNK